MTRLFLLIAFLGFCLQIMFLKVSDNYEQSKGEHLLYNFPAAVVKLVSLEFSGLVSDVMLLNLRSYVGKSLEGETRSLELDSREWSWFADRIDVISKVDPLFYDVYYFGSTILSMNPEYVDRNIALLSRASSELNKEWYFPFLLGWVYYFQKNDNARSAESLQESYRRNPQNTFLASFASRLLYEGNKTENAIIFLRSIIAENANTILNKSYEMRLDALEKIFLLEQLRDRYLLANGYYPSPLNQLVLSGYLDMFPKDPYGGEYYIDEYYQIKSTSDLGAVRSHLSKE